MKQTKMSKPVKSKKDYIVALPANDEVDPYKLLKEAKLFLEDFIKVLRDDGVNSYYCRRAKGHIMETKQIELLIKKISNA